jgi:arylsulfatase A-like enzyme
MLDDADYRDFAIYNPDTTVRTPNIETLADQGMVFDNFYANSPVCSPTRAAILSGNYPARYGINTILHRQSHRGLPGEVHTLAEYLGSRGYETAHVGKWHLGEERHNGSYLGDRKLPYRPRNQGFDHTVTTGSWRGFWATDVYVDNVFEAANGKHLDERFTDHALRFLAKHRNDRFFLNLAYFSPHWPLEPPPDWAEQFPNSDAGRFAALLSHSDEQIGRILDELDALGLTDSTAVLLLSDNGGDRRWHNHHVYPLRGFKGDLFEGGIRSPLVVRWPGLVAPGSRNDSVASTMDIYPTIVELLGDSPASIGFDGESFASALSGEGWYRSAPLFWQNKNNGVAAGYRHDFAVRDGSWKLVKHEDELYLFNIADDPAETNDLRSTQASRVTSMLADFSRWRTGVSRLSAAVASVAGEVSQSGERFAFDGRGHALLGNHPLHDFDDGDFAVRFRMKMGRGGLKQRLIGKTSKWRLGLGADNRLSLQVTGPSGVRRRIFGTTPLRIGKWYDLAVSFHGNDYARVDGSRLWVQVFVDGDLEIEGHLAPVVRIGYEAEGIKLSTNTGAAEYFVGEIESVQTFAGTLASGDL